MKFGERSPFMLDFCTCIGIGTPDIYPYLQIYTIIVVMHGSLRDFFALVHIGSLLKFSLDDFFFHNLFVKK